MTLSTQQVPRTNMHIGATIGKYLPIQQRLGLCCVVHFTLTIIIFLEFILKSSYYFLHFLVKGLISEMREVLDALIFSPLISQNPLVVVCFLSVFSRYGKNSIVMNVIPRLASRYFRSVALMCKVIDCLLFIKIIDSDGLLFTLTDMTY